MAARAATTGQAQGLPLRQRGGGCDGGAGCDDRAGTRPAPTAAGRGLRWARPGRHKACPYGSGEGVAMAARAATTGQAQGLPLRQRGGGCDGGAGCDDRAGTRPAPTAAGRGLRWRRGLRRPGRHKACPYGDGEGVAMAARAATTGQAQGLPLRQHGEGVAGRGLRWRRGPRRPGRHKACPYGSGEGVAMAARAATTGQAQGLPLRQRGGGCDCGAGCDDRAGTRPAPTAAGRGLDGGAGRDERAGTRPAPTAAGRGLRWRRGLRRPGRHKACPYGSGEGVAMAARVATTGQAQGLPLRHGRGFAMGRGCDDWAGTRPAPTERGGLRRGAWRGKFPQHKGGPKAWNCSGQWSVVSGQRLGKLRLRFDRDKGASPLLPEAL